MAISHVKTVTVPDWAGIVTVGNSTGGTSTANASDLARPSDWNSVHYQYMTLGGNTLGASTVSGTNIVFAGTNNVSLSANGSTVSIVGPDLTPYLTTAALSNHSHGNPTLALTNLSGTTASNSAGLTLSLSAAAPGGGADGVNILAAGTQTAATTGTVVFSNSNGITFGMSNSSQITASHNGLTSQSNQAFSAAGGSSSFQTLGFSDTNGVSFSNSNGSVVATVRTDYASSVHGHTLTAFATGNTTQSSTGTINLNSVIFQGTGAASLGVSNGSIVVSVPVGRASTDAIGLNTAQSNVTWTVNSSGLSLDARGYAGTGSTFNGANISGSMTVNSQGVNLSLSAGAGGTVNQTGPNIGVSNLGNTLGSTQTVSTGNVVFAGVSGITLSQSTGAANSNATITIIGPGVAETISSYQNVPVVNAASALAGQSVSMAAAFLLPEQLSLSFLRIPVQMTTNSTTLATTAATLSASAQINSTWNAVIYSLGTGASSKSLQSVASGSNGWTFMNSISVAVNGTQYSVTQGFSGNAEGAGTTRTTQYSISNTNYSFTTNQIATQFSGNRFVDIPMATMLTPGNYWIVFGLSTSSQTNSTGISAATNCNVRYSAVIGASQFNSTFGVMGSTNMTSGGLMGVGSFSTAGGGTTNSIPISAISSQASNFVPVFQMLRSA